MPTPHWLFGCVPLSLRSTVALVLTDDGKPTERLKELLAVHGLPHDGSFRSIVEATQTAWRPTKDGMALKAHELPPDTDSFPPEVARRTLELLDELGQQGGSLKTPALRYH